MMLCTNEYCKRLCYFMRRDILFAILLGTHPKIGKASPLFCLPQELVRCVWWLCRPSWGENLWLTKAFTTNAYISRYGEPSLSFLLSYTNKLPPCVNAVQSFKDIADEWSKTQSSRWFLKKHGRDPSKQILVFYNARSSSSRLMAYLVAILGEATAKKYVLLKQIEGGSMIILLGKDMPREIFDRDIMFTELSKISASDPRILSLHDCKGGTNIYF